MNGRDISNLHVIIEDKGGKVIARWSKSGHISSSWNQGQVLLPADTQKVSFYVKFTYKVAEVHITLCRN